MIVFIIDDESNVSSKTKIIVSFTEILQNYFQSIYIRFSTHKLYPPPIDEVIIIIIIIIIIIGEERGVHRVLVWKPEGKRPLGRPRRRWEDNIKMDLQKVGGGCGDWMELAQDRDRWRALVSTVMNLRVPKMRGIS